MSAYVRLLGPLAIGRDGGDLELGPARQRAVLAALLLADDHPVPVGELAARVWGEEPPQAANQTLRSHVCRLRPIIAVAGLSIERAAGGYLARPGDAVVDLRTVDRLAQRARVKLDAGEPVAALERLDEALALWTGEPLAGLTSPWLEDQRRAIEHRHRLLEIERNDLAIELGEAERVLPALAVSTAADPYDERLVGQLMLALHASGRSAEALATYERARRRLDDDLGIEPGAALREVHRTVLTARSMPRRTSGSAPTMRAPAPPSPVAGRPIPRQLPPAVGGFVDRASEAALLDEALLELSPLAASLAAGSGGPASPRIAAVTGTGGVGKTSLAVTWAVAHAEQFPDGQLFVDLRGFDVERPPMRVETALRCLAVALGADPAALPTDFDALLGLYRSLLAGRRILVVLDNASDSAQARPLLPPTAPAAGLITSRSELSGLAADPGARLVPLGMLPDRDARALLARRLGRNRLAAEPDSVDRLVSACAGLPLALAVVAGRAALAPHLPLSALADELSQDSARIAGLHADESGRDLQAALDASVAALPAATAAAFELIGLAPGPTLSIDALGAVCGADRAGAAAIVRSLSGLYLLDQPWPGRFRMHDLVRLYAAQRGRARPDAGIAVGRLIDFYRSVARAAAETVPAGGCDSSQETPALVAAVELAAAWDDPVAVCELAHLLEDPLGAIGCWRELARLSGLAIDAARQLGEHGREVVALVDLARARIGTADFADAAVALDRALQLAEAAADLAAQAGVHRALARLSAKQHRHDLALPHDERSLELHRATGDRLGEANAYNAIGWHLAHLGRATEALVSCERGLALFTALDDPAGRALTLDSIGYALERLDRHAEAQLCYRESADLADRLGWRVIRAETLTRLAVCYRRIDRPSEARAAQAEADRLLRAIGALAA